MYIIHLIGESTIGIPNLFHSMNHILSRNFGPLNQVLY